MKKIFKSKKIIATLFIVFLCCICFCVSLNKNNNEHKIDSILASRYYSYLPIEAKEYIKEIYEDTGEVIYTEKNKKDNLPYLNPQYVNYLTLNNEEKNELELIPNEFITDYVYDGKKVTASPTEKYYNLSDEGNNYTTPMKNQGSLGICWSYAIIENAETFLMLKKGQMYSNENTEVFSPRHLDYVTSSFGIDGYINKYGGHSLGSGSNFSYAAFALSKGLSLVDASWKYNDSYSFDRLELLEVFSDSLAKYELNSSIEVPVLNVKNLNLDNQNDLEKFNNYINQIKTWIKLYGGPYVGTQAPMYSCSAKNYYDNKHHIIDTDSECKKDGPHAMQIVGWDDDYSYKYCKSGDKHIAWDSSCSTENTVSGTGAWILRNSWGDGVDDEYTYLTYNSVDTEYDFITSLESMQEKNWDYSYDTQSQSLSINKIINNGSYEHEIKFVVPFEINAKLQKIKLRNIGQNREYDVYVSVSGSDSDYQIIKSFSVEYPGITTINFDENNINVNKKSKIKIISNSSLNTEYISVFTSESTDEISISTKDKYYEESDEILENGLYKIHLYSDIYNAPSNSRIDYKVYNQDGDDITENIIIKNNVVSRNMLNPTLYLPSINNNEYFIVKTFYNNKELGSSKLFVESPKPSKGKGTIEDPYVIMTPEDLYSINYNLNSHFVLGADIDLTYDTQNENGLYYNSGNGWTAIGYDERKNFTGSINGEYRGIIHKIKGLKTNSNGLIFFIQPKETDVSIKNLIFENAIVNDSNMLAYTITGNETQKVFIENIAAINCSFTNSNMLATHIKSYGKDSISINSIFSNSTFNETNAVSSVLAWQTSIYETYTTEASINISNVEILGKINNKSSSFTALIRFPQGKTKIENVIFNNYSSTKPYLFARLYSSTSGDSPILNNIYYLNDVNVSSFDSSYESNNFTSLSISDLRTEQKYENWENFDKYWIINNKDDIDRIPILKFVPFEYFSIGEINLKIGETANIYDYIYPQIDASKNIIFDYDDLTQYSVSIDDDGTIETLFATGSVNVHIKSLYDGYEDDIKINIYDSSKSIVKYYSNTYSNNLIQQVVDNNTSFNLNDNSFKRDGYTFKEWNTKEDGTGTVYSNGQEITLDDDLILYAQWEPIKYIIQFNSNDGKNDNYTQTLTYDIKEKLNKVTFVNDDSRYLFKEWNTKEDGTGTSYQNEELVLNMTNEDGSIVNLFAIWENSKMTITFNSNGGTGSMDSITVEKGTLLSLPQNMFTKEGYNFRYWNTKMDGTGTTYTSLKQIEVNSDIQLYAIWEPIKYNIYWYNEDGTKSNTGTNQYDVEYTFSGYKWTLKTGYMFKEWNTKMDGTGTSYKEGDKFKNLADRNYASVKLYSILEPIQYEVQFDANGGIGNMDSKVYKYDKEETLLANTCTKEGYLFKEWNTKADGSGTSYFDKQVILNLCNNNGDIIKLYAIWQTEVEPIKTIINNSKDFEGVYDGIEHSIVINVNINDYTIKYSVNSYEYNLSKLPKFKDVGEYTVNYKITADGYETLTGSNVVKIFGLKSFNSELTVKNNVIITNNNSFDNLINGITTYSTSTIFKHLDNNRNVDNTSIIKTGDIVLIKINNSLNYEYKISYLGDTNGDGKINYLDYVNVYNHIQKVKHPESTKKLLKNEYLMAADMSNDGNITYLDYVKIYKKIKELKGGAN